MSFITLNDTHLLDKWKLYHYHLPDLNLSAQVVRSDGVDQDQIMLLEAKQWYYNLLDTAPAQWLPTEEIKNDTWLQEMEPGAWRVILPSTMRRLVKVKLKEWTRPALVLTDPFSPHALRQRSPFTRSGPEYPVAIYCKPHLALYSLPQGVSPHFETVEVVQEPVPGEYIFEEQALLTMKPDNCKNNG